MWPVHLVRAAHPLQALATALVLAVAALASGRPAREAGLVAATVLVGQAVVGWHNDLLDRDRDAGHGRRGKPLASGALEPGTAWFALACGVLLLVPLALGNGLRAGTAYLLSVGFGLLANPAGRLSVRRTPFSWLPWAAAFGLLPAFLSYGGWGGQAEGAPPTILVTVLVAALGVVAHVLLALPDLVQDNADGVLHLPLRIALRTGARPLLWVSIVVAAVLVGALVVAGTTVGLRQ